MASGFWVKPQRTQRTQKGGWGVVCCRMHELQMSTAGAAALENVANVEMLPVRNWVLELVTGNIGCWQHFPIPSPLLYRR